MVNHGVSRACKTCKLRRKKCDETRPICQQCQKGGRTCLGYRDQEDLRFKEYRATTTKTSISPTSLIPRIRVTHSFPWYFDNASERDIDAQIERLALPTFLHDYCVVPKSRYVSRGYLGGLEKLLATARPSSDLVRATKATALANIGTKLCRLNITHKARVQYSSLLQSLRTKIKNGTMLGSTESLITIVVLGLYEMITATKSHPSSHGSHTRGIYAILSTKTSPLEILNWASRFQARGIFSAPTTTQPAHSLDPLVFKAWALLNRVEITFSSKAALVDDLRLIMEDATKLNDELSKWPDQQSEEWKPKPFEISDAKVFTFSNLGWPSCRIDLYFDLYVAAVWNIFRKVRLMVIHSIIRCATRLQSKTRLHDEKLEAERLAYDIVASIPFHLFENPTSLVDSAESCSQPVLTPGKAVGGLLLMHPLFIASKLSIVPPHLRAKMNECLVWLGTYMGIGQALLLQNSSLAFPNESIENGYTLILAGMLVDIDQNKVEIGTAQSD